MAEIWFISDTHFCHTKFLSFTDENGQLIRPEFKSIEEMDNTIVSNWNKHISKNDKVYHLGDVTSDEGPKFDQIMSSLNGKKRLILGNHDNLGKGHLEKFFEKISLWRVFKEHKFVCSHIPLPKSMFPKENFLNVHGHIHEKSVIENGVISPNHFNVCVERTNYEPVHLEVFLNYIKCKQNE